MATTVALPSFSFSNFMFGFLCGVVVFLVAIVVWANQTPGQSNPVATVPAALGQSNPVATVPAALAACTQSQATGYADLPTYCAAFPTDTCCTANSPQVPNTGNASSAPASAAAGTPTPVSSGPPMVIPSAAASASQYTPAPFT